MSSPNPIPLNVSITVRDDHVRPFKRERLIGQILCQSKGLEPAVIERILTHQRQHGGRFGEIAIALGLATEGDILEALAEQFNYPYSRSFSDGASDSELVCACDPLGEDADSFRELRTELLAGVLNKSNARALAVVSPQRGDGRSYVTANLAIAFAQLGARTLLVDADMRRPRQHTLFQVDDSVGLSNLLSGRTAQDFVQQPTQFPGLFVIGAGAVPPNPVELLQRAACRAVFSEWLAEFDHVVLDTPAASHGTEARIIAALAGAALVVARPHAARMSDMRRLLSSIERGPAVLAGVVMNEH